jgi:hypothetical protein
MDIWQNPHGQMGQIRQAGPDAYIRAVGLSDDLVVGRRSRDRNCVAIIIGWVGSFAGTCSISIGRLATAWRFGCFHMALVRR